MSLPVDDAAGYAVSADPDREADLHIAAWEGLAVADLQPLADLLRSDFEFDKNLANDIADAIEGRSVLCHIGAKRSRAGRPAEAAGALTRRNAELLKFIEERSGKLEAVIQEACDHFELGRAAVFKALHDARKYREKILGMAKPGGASAKGRLPKAGRQTRSRRMP